MKRITYLAAVSQLLSQKNTSMRFKLPILIVLLSGFSLSLSAQTVVDFTSMTDAQTFGIDSQADMGGGVFAMYGGDANSDGVVNATDLVNHWLVDNAQPFIYLMSGASDFNLDGAINSTDLINLWLPNNTKAAQLP